MKKLSLITNGFALMMLAFSIFSLTSCGDDNPVDGALGPSVTFAVGETSVDTSATLTFTITGNKGDAALKTLTLNENGSKIDLGRISGSGFAGNPNLLLGDNTTEFNYIVEVKGPATAGEYSYTAEVADENNKTTSKSVSVTVVEPVVELVPPTISYAGANPFQTGFGISNFSISVAKGSSNLSTLTVYQNGEVLAADLVRFNNDPVDANPYTLPESAQEGFESSVGINLNQSGSHVYKIEVTDAQGQMVSSEINVLVGTTIAEEYTGKIFANAASAEPDGGFDLSAGVAVSVNSSDANIIDSGIDSDLPAESNWVQKIQPANGTTLKAVTSQSENFTYENATTKEAIVAAYDNETAIEETAVVETGNLFIALENDTYYLIKVTNVVVTPDNNRDHYEISVKVAQ